MKQEDIQTAILVVVCLILIGIVCIFCIQSTPESHNQDVEHFEDVKLPCPTAAIRTPDGQIQIQPGDRKFPTMIDYVKYLNEVYAKGGDCIPPKVQSNTQPVPGIIGGLGTGTEGPEGVALQGSTREVLNFSSTEEQAFAKTPINKLDDYEYTRVFESENDKRNSLSHHTKSELINNHKLDWANMPFNSEKRAKEEDEFVSERLEDGFRDPKTGIFFKNIDGDAVRPPDPDAKKEKEDKEVKPYSPSKIGDQVINNEMEQVAEEISKLYKNDENWEPVVSRVGEHHWEISELRPKRKKEKYEDETVSLALAEERGQILPTPAISIDDRNRDDPYFDKSGVGDRDNNKFWKYEDFTKWTPGLERMFAPTLSNKEWH